jgi:hypothetical protein
MNRVFVVIVAHDFLHLFVGREIPYNRQFPGVFERTRVIDGGFDVEVRKITAVVALGQVQLFGDGGRF